LFFFPFIKNKIYEKEILNKFEIYKDIKIKNISEYVLYIKENIMDEFTNIIKTSKKFKQIDKETISKSLNTLEFLSKKTKEHKNLKRELNTIN
jgi:hypothetical protein